jgi:hypothetical protein
LPVDPKYGSINKNMHTRINSRPKNTKIRVEKVIAESKRYPNYKMISGSPVIEFNSNFPAANLKKKTNIILNEVINNSEIRFKKKTKNES